MELMVSFVYFLMIYWRRQRRKRYRRRIRKMAAIQIRLQAFYNQHEEDLRKIVAALIADRIICSTMQRRVLWVRNRSQSFTNITASWEDLKWKRNSTLTFGSHFIAPLKRFS